MDTKKPDNTRNPHDPNSPEWQLFENWRSSFSLVRDADHDIAKATSRRSEAMAREKAYAAALKKLGHPVN